MPKYLRDRYKILLALLLFVTLIKGIPWVLFIPIFQSVDENQHYLYIQYLAEFKKLPPQKVLFESEEVTNAYQLSEFEKLRHILENKQNFAEGQIGINELELRDLGIRERQEGKNVEHFLGTAVIYPPLYYTIGALIYRIFYNFDFIDRFYALRIGFLILPILTVYFSFKVADEFFKNKRDSLVVASLVSFLPQYSFISAMLNNDNLLILLVTIYLYYLFYIFNKGLTTGRVVILGIIAGLAFLTKPQALIIIPVGIIALLATVIFLKKIKLAQALKYLFYFIFFLISVSGWWYFRNYLLYNSWIGLAIKSVSLVNDANINFNFLSYFWYYFLDLSFSFLGCFGWMDIIISFYFYIIFDLLVLSSLVGTIFYFKRNRRFSDKSLKIIFFLVLIVTLSLFVFYLNVTSYLDRGSSSAYTQGRSLFSIISIFFILFLFGIYNLVSDKFYKSDFKKATLTFLVLFMISLNIISLFFYVIVRYYL